MQIDLEPHEWRREGQREPFWGPNAKMFFIMFALALVIAPVVALTVDAAIAILWPQSSLGWLPLSRG